MDDTPLVQADSIRLPNGVSCEVYLPQGFDSTQRHPLVLALSPNGDGRLLLPAWKEACDRQQWILVASNNSRNGPQAPSDAALLLETIEEMERRFPIDPSRIFVAGFSGGAMRSYDLITSFPNLFRGVVINSGTLPYHARGNPPLARSRLPHGRLAVLLVSPSDPGYSEMQDDSALLQGFGWKVHWLEFSGGHEVAPPSSYAEAAEWLSRQ